MSFATRKKAQNVTATQRRHSPDSITFTPGECFFLMSCVTTEGYLRLIIHPDLNG